MFLTFDLAFPAIECNCFCAPAAPEFFVGGGGWNWILFWYLHFLGFFICSPGENNIFWFTAVAKSFYFFFLIFYSVLSVVYLWRSRFGIW